MTPCEPTADHMICVIRGRVTRIGRRPSRDGLIEVDCRGHQLPRRAEGNTRRVSGGFSSLSIMTVRCSAKHGRLSFADNLSGCVSSFVCDCVHSSVAV